MGTMIQKHAPGEQDYRGQRFASLPGALKGCHDVLCLTRPDIIAGIHRQYLEAGADIITANSFNANAISLADYGLQDYAFEIAAAAAAIARREADSFTEANPAKPRFVAGTVGPTNKTASIASDMMNPAARDVSFDTLADAYRTQIEGLLHGGADIILIETIFDTLNAKAAIYALKSIERQRGEKIPLMISATVSDSSGRTLSGQTLEAFYASGAHAEPLAVGLNCAFGPEQLLPFSERLSKIVPGLTSCHPNAGLPDEMGEYVETPEVFAAHIRRFLERSTVNIIGGCCGTTPDHIRLLNGFIGDYRPRKAPENGGATQLSNLECLTLDGSTNFINIGERTNVAGSARFARLIREGNFAEAVSVARKQIEAGAQVIDVCMDDAMLDAPAAMTTFLNILASEPEISRVPVMIDSSKWEAITAGLKVSQGKCIVNSISLKEGEEAFLQKAREIRRFGAAVVVMLFDEKGQADTLERKIEVARRSYDLLTANGFPARDIIFDPNILTIGTGIEAHDRYAVDFIEAVRWIKANLPGAHTSGGVSNLSFAFRGNNPVREAIHSVFLYHAIAAGLDMAIVNSEMVRVYSDIEPRLLQLVEDLVLARRPDATDRLTDYAHSLKERSSAPEAATPRPEKLTPEASIREKLLRGISDGVEADIEALIASYGDGLTVIDKVLMPAMDHIGTLFGEGKMFLPQVIKSARVLKQAIGLLEPAIASSEAAPSRGTVVAATVRGDIHDIGKNIVALVAGCNGFEVKDLGVMVDAEAIAVEAKRSRPVAVLLSGLITPSLAEMAEACRTLGRHGLSVPVIVGGATTSALHTALKIAPEYAGPVFHSADAGHNSRILSALVSDAREEFIADNASRQERLRADYLRAREVAALVSPEEARAKASKKAAPGSGVKRVSVSAFTHFPIADVEEFIDWQLFFTGWGLKGRWPAILDDPKYGEEARSLQSKALDMLARIKRDGSLKLQAVYGTFPARRHDEDIILSTPGGERRLPMLRSQEAAKKGECLADFVAEKNDSVTLFALTAGVGLKDLEEKYRGEGDDFSAVMAKLIANCLAEAFADKMSERYPGCRFAFGYPSVPDHTLKRDVFEILDVESVTAMRLTENAMIIPEESVCGIIIPGASYFTLGSIGADQLASYARRRGLDAETMERLLPPYLVKK